MNIKKFITILMLSFIILSPIFSDINILNQLGIQNAINNIVPLNNINNITILENQTSIIVNTSPEIETQIIFNLSSLVSQLTKQNDSLIVQPFGVEQTSYLIEINTNNESLIYTVIEQTGVNRLVVEYIPKTVANSSNDIIIAQGELLQVLNPEPLLEIEPVNDTITFIIPGNVINQTNNIEVYQLGIEYTNNNTISILNSSSTSYITNLSNYTINNYSNVTNNKSYTNSENPGFYIVIVLIIILVVIFLYYILSKR